jgi:hypothetical protein
MPYIILLYLFVFSLGFLVYLRKPKCFFLYWLSVPAFIVPLFFILFNPIYVGEQTFDTFYWGYQTPLSYLLLVITILEFFRLKGIGLKKLLTPFLVLVFFLIFQNFLKGFKPSPLISNIREAVFLMLPTLALQISPRLRPLRNELIRFVLIFIAIQTVFCLLNNIGIRIYTKFNDDSSFADEYFCGTFLRYNHLTNYLTTLYLLLSIAYFVNFTISKWTYVILSCILGTIVLLSGARISVVLFFMTLILFLLLYRGKKLVLFLAVAFIVAYNASSFLSSYNVGTKNADQGTGFERNVTGLSDMFDSKSIEDNTLSLSGYLFLTKFNNPLFGNGYAFWNGSEYEMSESLNENVMQTDARMAYMIVEYGIIGCLCFAFLFYGIFKNNSILLNQKSGKLWSVIVLYYIAFTFTETGMFDLMQLSMISIYCASVESVKQISKSDVIRSIVKIENAAASN